MLADRIEEMFLERMVAAISDVDDRQYVYNLGRVWLEATDEEIQALADFLIEEGSRSSFNEKFPGLSLIIMTIRGYPNKDAVLSYLRYVKTRASSRAVN